MTAPIFCDESDGGFGWISPEPAWMGRASHALAADGACGSSIRSTSRGSTSAFARSASPARCCSSSGGTTATAHRSRLAWTCLASSLPRSCPALPFETIRVPGVRGWRETALWWPERSTLVVSEAVGTVRYFRAPGRAMGVHPLLRIYRPPSVLLGFEPEHILCGHGRGLHIGAASALQDAVRFARRDLPRVLPRIFAARRHPSL